MKMKILCLTAAALCATITVASAAPLVKETPQQTQRRVEDYVNACRAAYIEYRYSRVRIPGTETYTRMSPQEAMNKATSRFPENERIIVTLICLGYGEGYEDGRRGTT